MNPMLLNFAERIIAGLQKRAVQTPSRWVQEHGKNIDGSAFSFKKYPWQKEMFDSTSPINITAKGAQLGISRMALLRGMCANDMEHRDVLYVLPSMNPIGNEFSSARFDGEVAQSAYLQGIYDRSNVGHKRTSTNNFYIRGAQSKAGGKSVPAGFLIIDEIDEVPREFLPLVRERMSGQALKTEWDISTPTIPEHGISKLWDESTQEHFFFACPYHTISTPDGPTQPGLIHLTYPECLVIVGDDPDSHQLLHESYLQCPDCKHILDHYSKELLLQDAKFIPAVTGKEKRGFHVNQLYSSTVTPGEFAASAVRAQLSEIDAQEFYNSKLGKAHAPEGSKLTDALIDACKGNHLNSDAPKEGYTVRTMGVDVGSRMHFEIDEWWIEGQVGEDVNSYAVPTVIHCGWVRSPEELDALMVDYRINMCVIDAMPETRMAFSFSQRFNGFVKLCYYQQGLSGRLLHETNWTNGEPVIQVNRTAWLDQALGRVKANKIVFPMDLPFEYVEHLKTPARIWSRDRSGNPVASYKTPDGKADHHAHARNYAEIALPLAMSVGQVQNVRGPYG